MKRDHALFTRWLSFGSFGDRQHQANSLCYCHLVDRGEPSCNSLNLCVTIAHRAFFVTLNLA